MCFTDFYLGPMKLGQVLWRHLGCSAVCPHFVSEADLGNTFCYIPGSNGLAVWHGLPDITHIKVIMPIVINPEMQHQE